VDARSRLPENVAALRGDMAEKAKNEPSKDPSAERPKGPAESEPDQEYAAARDALEHSDEDDAGDDCEEEERDENEAAGDDSEDEDDGDEDDGEDDEVDDDEEDEDDGEDDADDPGEELRETVEVATERLAGHPDDAGALLFRGEALADLGEPEKARADL